jgi:hypothetical protein
VNPGNVCQWARALREALRPSPDTASKRHQRAYAWTHLGLLERELNPDRLPPEREVGYHGTPEVRRALADLRGVCYRLAECWGIRDIWGGQERATPDPLQTPDPPPALVDFLADAAERLEMALTPTGREGQGGGSTAAAAGQIALNPLIEATAKLSAPDLARLLGQPAAKVESFLRRYRDSYPDCYVEVDPEDRRRNEPRYLYRACDVLPALCKHLERRPSK